MKRIGIALLVLAAMPLAVMAQLAVNTQSFTAAGTDQSPTPTGGFNTCSLQVAGGSGYTIVPKGSSDNGLTYPTTVTTIGGGSITGPGNYSGSIAGLSMTNFEYVVTGTISGTVTITKVCNVQLAPSSGGGTVVVSSAPPLTIASLPPISGTVTAQISPLPLPVSVNNSPAPTYTPYPQGNGQKPALPVLSYPMFYNPTSSNYDSGLVDPNDLIKTTPAFPVGLANHNVGQVSCTTTATQIVAARTGIAGTGRAMLTLANTGTTEFFIGPTSSVTTANGFPIFGILGTSYTFATTTAEYCITASGTAVVGYSETY